MFEIADAVTQCKFEASDKDTDEVVLYKILQVRMACFCPCFPPMYYVARRCSRRLPLAQQRLAVISLPVSRLTRSFGVCQPAACLPHPRSVG